MRGIRRRLVLAASGISGPRFRALAASSLIATSAIIGSALAGGDNGILAALVAQAQGQQAQAPDSATADATPAGPSGPAIPPPPPTGGAGPSAPAPAPAPAPVSTAPSAPPAETTTTQTTPTEPTEPEAPAAPTAGSGPVKHVFVISLASPGYDETFGEASLMPYLNDTLRPEGELLSEYSLLTAAGLPNRIALIAGQPPNPLTSENCTTYEDYPATALPDKNGLVKGAGCIYPVQALTIADQINSGGLVWRAYMEGMENDFGSGNCVHPDFGGPDEPVLGGYAPTHNPFAYFHSLLDLGACSANDVPLDGLTKDLRKPETTPNYAYISPTPCDAGVPGQCEGDAPAPADPAASAARADAFLKTWVPRIQNSAAFKKDGALIITFTEANPPADPTEPPKVGTLLLSGSVPAGSTVGTPYDPYSLLRSVEDLLVLDPLANAAAKGTESFASQLAGGGG